MYWGKRTFAHFVYPAEVRRDIWLWLAAAAVILLPVRVCAQQKIDFLASDRLEVTADLYLLDKGAPYIILLHQENGSRGEYKEIAPKLLKLGFNCLAVDLRSGKECNFIQNETAIQAKKKDIPVTAVDCEKDILAAVEYISKTAIRNRYILFGSSFSASLAMKVANHDKKATAVIAFSPGEYFVSTTVKDWLTDFDKLVFVTCTKRELPFVTDMIKDISPQNLTIFQPSDEGVHGASALWDSNTAANEYWMSLMVFMQKVKEAKYK